MTEDEKVKEIRVGYESFCNHSLTPKNVSWEAIRSWYITHVGELLSLLSEQGKDIERLREGIRKHKEWYTRNFHVQISGIDEELYKLLEVKP